MSDKHDITDYSVMKYPILRRPKLLNVLQNQFYVNTQVFCRMIFNNGYLMTLILPICNMFSFRKTKLLNELHY